MKRLNLGELVEIKTSLDLADLQELQPVAIPGVEYPKSRGMLVKEGIPMDTLVTVRNDNSARDEIHVYQAQAVNGFFIDVRGTERTLIAKSPDWRKYKLICEKYKNSPTVEEVAA